MLPAGRLPMHMHAGVRPQSTESTKHGPVRAHAGEDRRYTQRGSMSRSTLLQQPRGNGHKLRELVFRPQLVLPAGLAAGGALGCRYAGPLQGSHHALPAESNCRPHGVHLYERLREASK